MFARDPCRTAFLLLLSPLKRGRGVAVLSSRRCWNNGDSVLSAMCTIPSHSTAGTVWGALFPITYFPTERPVRQALLISLQREKWRLREVKELAKITQCLTGRDQTQPRYSGSGVCAGTHHNILILKLEVAGGGRYLPISKGLLVFIPKARLHFRRKRGGPGKVDFNVQNILRL